MKRRCRRIGRPILSRGRGEDKKNVREKRNVSLRSEQRSDEIKELVVGDVVFARLSLRSPWWPGLIIDPRMCGYILNGKTWVFWLGDNRISDADPANVRLLSEDFAHCFRVGGSQSYIVSVQKAVELYARQIGATFCDEPLDWALRRFKLKSRRPSPKDAPPVKYFTDNQLNDEAYHRTIFPVFVLDRLKVIKNLQPQKDSTDENEPLTDADTSASSTNNGPSNTENSTEDDNSECSAFSPGITASPPNKRILDTANQIKSGQVDIGSYCLACGTNDNIYTEHPLFEGHLCAECLDLYKEACFVYDQDGKKEHCSICCGGGDLIICDNPKCTNVFCQTCVTAYDSHDSLQRIMQTDPWSCYICTMQNSTLLKPHRDWETRLFELFKTVNVLDELDLSLLPAVKRSIRVLSLFDGLATAKIVLDQLLINTEVYYCCEIDPEATLVSKVNHSNSITYLGDVRNVNLDKLKQISPIDLVIGGSPCNDFSIANPKRKGLYDPSGTGILFFEFYRILQTILQLNNQRNLNTFWLYENVASMRMEFRSVIDRFLGRTPALYDSCHFSAQNRARYFWGNIPGMYSYIPSPSSKAPCINDVLVADCGRVAMVDKVRTITTKSNSLKQGRSFSVHPISMDGKPDILWPTELESLFGLPRHYTDVGSLSPAKRQKLIGQGWTVPVVKHILRPLQKLFKAKQTS